MTYQAPVDELRFALQTVGQLSEILALPGNEALDVETVDAILDEAAKFASEVIAPTNRTGDLHGASLVDGSVQTHPEIAAAFEAFRDAGWFGLRAPADFGGQGLPALLAAACEEMWCAGNLAFSLLPMLTLGAIEAIYSHANDEQKQRFLPKMCEGVWSGTMNLTEPQAGSDLGQVSAKAVPKGDGTYLVSGQKIFITWGDQTLTENIVHLVLARLPDAAPGVKGISLFIVPKLLIHKDGSLGERNSVYPVSLEHKLGIHASPTCVMQFDEAEAYLIGEPGRGLNYMFTMMNHARLGVGIEGHAVAERAYQASLNYAKERMQSRRLGSTDVKPVAIIKHPDVARMLLVQKATLAAQRALYLSTAMAIDVMHHHPVESERISAQKRLNFLIPIVKSWCTDNGTTLSNIALQVFGGMGYVEESGVAQYVRDVRITSIYEGTNGIQALDLLSRKTAADQGATARQMIARARATAEKLAHVDHGLAERLQVALDLAATVVQQVLDSMQNALEKAAVAAVSYLNQMAITLGAALLAEEFLAADAALKTGELNGFETLPAAFYERKKATVRVYFEQVLPDIEACAKKVLSGSDAVAAFPMEVL